MRKTKQMLSERKSGDAAKILAAKLGALSKQVVLYIKIALCWARDQIENM